MPVTDMVAHLRRENLRLRQRVRELEADAAQHDEPAFALFSAMATHRPWPSVGNLIRAALLRAFGSRQPPAQKRA